jgi:hypothetical protein
MEDEQSTLREQIAKSKAAEEIVEMINQKPTESSATPQLTQDQLDALIEKKVTATLTAQEQAALATSNLTNVVDKFKEVYGDKDKAKEAYEQKAKDLGLSIDYVNNLAATSPKAVFELYGLKDTQSVPTKITSDVNSEAAINTNVVQDTPKSVMGQSTHKDDIAAWKAAAPTE